MANSVDIGPGEFVAGDNHELTITDADISTAGQIATDAWLTVKQSFWDADLLALVQKHITGTNAPNVGQITNTGANGQPVTLRFDLMPADTAKLAPPLYQPWFRYDYDIQIKTQSGNIYTSVEGLIVADSQVTQATS